MRPTLWNNREREIERKNRRHCGITKTESKRRKRERQRYRESVTWRDRVKI